MYIEVDFLVDGHLSLNSFKNNCIFTPLLMFYGFDNLYFEILCSTLFWMLLVFTTFVF